MSRLEQLKKLVEFDPQDPLAHFGIGLECIGLERWDEAIAALAKVLECDPTYSAAYYHKGRAEIHAGRHDQARATLAEGIECAQAGGDMKTVGEMRDLLESIA